jgi:hypothetical protein
MRISAARKTAAGKLNKQIAAEIGIAERAVRLTGRTSWRS